MADWHLVIAGRYATAHEPGVHAFAFDARAGALAPRGAFGDITNPSFLTLHPTRDVLYVASETAQATDAAAGSVVALAFDRDPFGAAPLARRPSGGDGPCHVATDPAARWLLASNYMSGSLAVLPLAPDGTPGELADVAHHEGSGPVPGRQATAHPHSAQFAFETRTVIACDLGIDAVLVYSLAPGGRLVERHRAATRSGAGPRHAAIHPRERVVYVANELDCTVTVYDFNDGWLLERQTLATLPRRAPPSTVSEVALDAGAQRLYVANRGDDSIAVFTVDRGGGLERLATAPSGGRCPRHFSVAPDGRHLVIAHQESGDLCVLPATGDGLGAPVARVPLPHAACVRFCTLRG